MSEMADFVSQRRTVLPKKRDGSVILRERCYKVQCEEQEVNMAPITRAAWNRYC